MNRMAFALLMCCNCAEPWDVTIGLNPETALDADWTAQVQAAIDTWNEPMYQVCMKPAFVIDQMNGYKIELLSKERFKAKIDGDNTVGYFDGDEISVMVQSNKAIEMHIIIHEMGHAIGLGHTDPEKEPWSVMHPVVDLVLVPSAKDIARAAEYQGCI